MRWWWRGRLNAAPDAASATGAHSDTNSDSDSDTNSHSHTDTNSHPVINQFQHDGISAIQRRGIVEGDQCLAVGCDR